MALERDAYCRECVEVELNVVPESVLAGWGFKKGQVLAVILPVMLDVFTLPGEGAREGSPEWIKSMIARELFPFKYLVEYPPLMDAYVRRVIASLVDGKIPLMPGETIPNVNYSRSKTYNYLPTQSLSRSFANHDQLFPLRRVNVKKAMTEVRNLGCQPFMTDPATMPNGIPLDNFAYMKIVFFVYYCLFEGISETSDLARSVQVYMFHGKCAPRQTSRGVKQSSIIFELRRTYMHGLNAFTNLTKYFNDIVEYLAQNPGQKLALADHKHKATNTFIALWEVGLRKCALARNSPLGKNAMETPRTWDEVSCGNG